MKLDTTRGAKPLYLQIAEILKDKINTNEFAIGEIIPGELELEKIYSVSRITVRQAIAELEREGYVKRERGKGTTVIGKHNIVEYLTEIKSFSDEMTDRGLKPSSKNIIAEIKPADESVADVFGIEPQTNIFHLHRIRCADDEAIAVFDSYLTTKVDWPKDAKAWSGSMYGVFKKQGLDKPVRINETYVAIIADEGLAAELGVAQGYPVFKRIRISFDSNDEVVEYSNCYYRGDRYNYSIELLNK